MRKGCRTTKIVAILERDSASSQAIQGPLLQELKLRSDYDPYV